MVVLFAQLRKPFARLIVFLAFTLALTACDPGAVGTGPSLNTRRAVPVALLVPGGSGQMGDALLAKSLENAARLAMADLDGVQIDLRVYDTAGDAALAAEVAATAVNDGAKIILGPVFAQSANAVGVAVAGRGINVLSFSNNTEIAGGNVFVLGPTFQNTANRLVRYSVRAGKPDMMIVRDQQIAGELGAAAIRSAAAANGANIVNESSYEFSQNGVVQAVPLIANAAKTSGAQTIFFTANTDAALPLLVQLLPENGVDSATFQFIGLTRWDIPPSFQALPGAQGGWFALPDPALSAQFRSRYQAAYGEAPHHIAGLAYDGIAAIGALVRKGGADALSVRSLTQGSGFIGVNGVFRLLPDGTNERGLAVAEIRNNQVVVIDPAPRSFGGPGL
ncbi:ABC transporter substrate-binding protein [Rhodovulum sp. NI22]|nr:ABC transporter substrate-binding protein [Rhodovulum sp. NI22]